MKPGPTDLVVVQNQSPLMSTSRLAARALELLATSPHDKILASFLDLGESLGWIAEEAFPLAFYGLDTTAMDRVRDKVRSRGIKIMGTRVVALHLFCDDIGFSTTSIQTGLDAWLTCPIVVEDCFRFINLREREVVELRFGLRDGIPLGAADVARILGLTTLGVQRIEKRAMIKLRSYVASGATASRKQ